MRWIPYIPSRSTLALLFEAAKSRVAKETSDIRELPTARIISATEELNQIADDVRDLHTKPETEISKTRT